MFDVSVSNICFIGNDDAGCGYDAVHANRGVIIDNCLFSEFEDAIRLFDCYTPSVQNCVIWNNRRHGIHILDGHNVTLFNNRVENSGHHGIHCTHTPTNAGTAITFYGNVCQGNGCAGYSFEGVSQFYMGGNFAEGNNRKGEGWGAVHITTSEGVKNTSHSINGLFITAGYSTAKHSVGIHVDSARHVSFRDVHIRSNGKIDKGIELAGSVGVAIVDNCHFEGVREGIVVASDRTMVHYTPRLAQAHRHGRVFQGPGQVSKGLEFRQLQHLQIHAGRQGAGFVGIGTVDGEPAVQAHRAGKPSALHLNPNGGNVAVGHHEPAARLDVDGGARFREGDVVLDGDWQSGRLCLGSYFLWVDSAGHLRTKRGEPLSDDDGRVVVTAEVPGWLQPVAQPLQRLRSALRRRRNGGDAS
jgi:parallel beta-helix repeat protein